MGSQLNDDRTHFRTSKWKRNPIGGEMKYICLGMVMSLLGKTRQVPVENCIYWGVMFSARCKCRLWSSESRRCGGRAVAQAVSRLLRAQPRSCGIFDEQSDTGAGFLLVPRFPLPILIPPNDPYSCIIRGWYNGPISGRRTKWTESQPTSRNKLQAYLGDIAGSVPDHGNKASYVLFFLFLTAYKIYVHTIL
jgi:hypothetical protein